MFVVFFILVIIFVLAVARPMQKAYDTIKLRQQRYESEVDERIFYMQNVLSRRRYVPLSTLPHIDFGTSLETISDGEIKCLSVPTYVGLFNTPAFDCTEMCDNPNAFYFFVGPFDRFVVGGELLHSGGYCTTNSLPRNCNRETSVIIQSLNQWTCIAEDPRYFAGAQNMTQVAGRQHADRIRPGQVERNVLFDRQLGIPVDVSRNTFRSSWDELLTDGSRRFEMRCDARDINDNVMFVNPLNPIECLPHVCTNVSNITPMVRPDFVNGVCDCGNFAETRVRNMIPDDPTSMCASVVDGFDREALAHVFRIDCISLNMPISRFSPNMLLCPEELMETTGDSAYSLILPGTFPMSGTGIHEPTYRQYRDMRSRINWRIHRPIPSV
ncbi:PIF-2 [Alphabaculovirus altermyunipunctae]|uniref:PIF-2 n=1 Tax=Mythimna unipuncta nucleopolyhedrovirus TaxID=447897 RepID=A0A346TPT3_9ABAC|nr:PIF-2 [Mythimna unipuncta nucleopolyhedrovirus]AXU41593.1 PIF-2 [Mythimna unipuncta nucleopolyhedrovirus]